MDRRNYRILDLGVSLESDNSAFLNLFDLDYGGFRTEAVKGKKKVSVLFDRQGETLRINHRTFSLAGNPNKSAYCLQQVAATLFSHVQLYLLLHAGVVARDRSALIIAGPPGAGKSTLVSELINKGFTFFSDEMCPLHRETGLVYPFPRSLRLAAPDQKGGSSHQKKTHIPADQFLPSHRNRIRPSRPGWLICLDPGKECDPYTVLELGLKEQGEERVIASLRNLEGVLIERRESPFSEWLIRYPKDKGLTSKVREVLQRHSADLWNVFREDGIRPDFTGEPSLSRIPLHEATFQLLGGLKQDWDFDETTRQKINNPGMLFMKLNTLLDGVPCFRLKVGRLAAMIELLCRLDEFT